jgi:hypothetical protein
MIRKSSIACVIFFVTILGFDGCLAPGLGMFAGKSEVKDKESMRKVVRVCILPATSTTDYSGKGSVLAKPEFKPAPDDSATMQVWREINARHFLRLVSMDSLRDAVYQAGGFDTNKIAEVGRALSVDAFLTVRIRYFWNSINDIPSAIVAIGVVSPDHGKVLAYGSYDTARGKNYLFSSPSIDEARADAVKGAVDELVNAFNSARTP